MKTLQEIRSRLSEIAKRSQEIDGVLVRFANGETVEGVEFDTINTESQSLRNESVTLRAQEAQLLNSANFNGAGKMASSTTPTVAVRSIDTPEYDQAFFEFVTRGTAIPMNLRADATTTTADGAALIPTTLVQKIISEMSTYGNVWNKVTKLNIQGGVQYPIMDLKPTAKWITETGVSENQKLTAKDTISFSYFGIECRIAQTLLSSIVTLSIFQAKFTELATEAIVRGIETAIISGTGVGQPLGILNDTRVKTENVIELTDAEFGSWKGWHDKVFSKIKKSYQTGELIMTEGTFISQIAGMVDANGQPIARTNYGIEGTTNYRFAGKSVETVEEDLLPSFSSAAAGDVVAIFIKLSDYSVNSNLALQTVKWTDHLTNKLYTKAIMIADGKLLDPNGVLIIKKASGAATASTTSTK